MGSGVLIVCEGFAEEFFGHAVPGCYFARLEKRPSGGVTVVWTDEPEEAAVFGDIAAAEAFVGQPPLTLFEVSFARVPGSGQPPAAVPAAPGEPLDLVAEIHAMGLM
jgi:hypothetical protein